MPITKAIFPIAGMGTRVLPATKATAKEMLTVVDKPLIQYAVEEAYAAGIREMIFITGDNQQAVKQHFDTAHDLTHALSTQNKHDLSAAVHAIKPHDMTCTYIRQPEPLGLGHAVLCAQPLIGNEAFAVLLADDLMVGSPPIMQQMVDLFSQHQYNLLAVQKVARMNTGQYGIVRGNDIDPRLLKVTGLIEKPDPDHAPSTLAISGRYILTPDIFDHLNTMPPGKNNEIQLTDAIAALLKPHTVMAYHYDGIRYDCGSKLGLLQANVDLGRAHPKLGQAFSTWLENQVNKKPILCN